MDSTVLEASVPMVVCWIPTAPTPMLVLMDSAETLANLEQPIVVNMPFVRRRVIDPFAFVQKDLKEPLLDKDASRLDVRQVWNVLATNGATKDAVKTPVPILALVASMPNAVFCIIKPYVLVLLALWEIPELNVCLTSTNANPILVDSTLDAQT